MQIVGVLSLLLVFVMTSTKSLAEIIWDSADWSPIPGRCLTCEKGRLSFLESSQNQLTPISEREARSKRRLTESSEISLFTAKLPQGKSTSDRVHLVYLPEGAINGLQSANVARILNGANAISRSKRSSPLILTSHSFAPIDQVADESTITFREVSPRMPMALVAESGREREAQEQIQLLEAALRAQPTHIQEDELPRVFIAPTNLPPPPGYVKIPLLPNRKQAENKVLPGTFLTSELHQELPPGFIQVPLPERISQLSHTIPFVDPKSNRVLQSRVRNQGSQLDSSLRIRQPEQRRNLGHPPHNAFIPSEDFSLRQPPQSDPRTQQQFAIQEPTHGVQPPQQQVVHDVRSNKRQKINRGTVRHNQNPNFVSVTNLRNLGQSVAQDNQNHQITPETRVDQNSRPISNVQDQNSFVEIGSSVIKTPESLGNLRQKHILKVSSNDGVQDLGGEVNDKPSGPGSIRQTFERQKSLDDTPAHLPLDKIKVSNDEDQIASVPLDTITRRPFQLSPKPIEVDSLPQSPQKTNNIQPVITRGPPVKLFPKPVVDFDKKTNIGKPVRPKARGRGRPSRPNSSRSSPTSRRRRPNRTRINSEPEDILKVGTQAKSVRTTTPQPVKNDALNSRSRKNFSRRRNPKQKVRNLSENPKKVITTTKETSTIFPPFSVAKKLNGATISVDSKRKENSRGRRRFGSRIRQRGIGRSIDDKENPSKVVEGKTKGILPTDQEQVVESRQQRLHQRGGRRPRVRGRNGRPAGKRRRILNRVRKINDPEKNSLNGDELLKGNELRGSESSRILISRAATIQDTDPIAQTLDLINQGENMANTKTENKTDLQGLEIIGEPQNFEENTTSNPSAQGMDDIFNLLNLGKIKHEGTVESTTTGNFNEDDIFHEMDPSVLQTENIGYVNDKEQFSTISSVHEFLDDLNPTIDSLAAHPLEGVNSSANFSTISVGMALTPLLSDSSSSFISQSPYFRHYDLSIASHTSDKLSMTKTQSFLDSSNSQHSLKNSTDRRTDVSDLEYILDSISDIFDNTSDTFLPDILPVPRDNFLGELDAVDHNDTLFGSDANIVYAVALSEPTPYYVTDNDNITTTTDAGPIITKDLEVSSIWSEEETTLKMESDQVITTTERTLSNNDTPLQSEVFNPDIHTIEMLKNKGFIDQNEAYVENSETNDDFIETTTHTSKFIEQIDTNVDPSIDLIALFDSDSSVTSLKSDYMVTTEIPSNDFESTDSPSKVKLTSSIYQSNRKGNLLLQEFEIPTHTTISPRDFETTILEIEAKPITEENPFIRVSLTTNRASNASEIVQPMLTQKPEHLKSRNTKQYNKADDEEHQKIFFTRRGDSDVKMSILKEKPQIIGHSTVTEVRSSAPMICIDGNCVIGTGIRRKR